MLVSQKLDGNESVSTVEKGVEHLNIKWHLGREFLGVSSFIPSKGGFLSFYTKKGGKPFFSSAIKHDQFPNCIDWHPFDTVLAVGWESGRLELTDPNRRNEITILDTGLDKVCCVRWNESGSILLAVDMNGSLKAYEFDSRQWDQQAYSPKCLNSGRIVDEVPTDICPKQLDRKMLDYSGGAEKRAIERSSSGGSSGRRRLGDSEGKDGLTELLNKHKRFMEFEEEKQIISSKLTGSQASIATVFLISTNKGGIHAFDPVTGQLFRIFQADSGIRQLLDILPEKSFYVLAISEGMMFYELAFEGRLANDKIKVKLTGKHEHFSMIRIDSGLIALCYGEREIRIWDLENEDSAVLALSTEKGFDAGEQVICLSYSAKKGGFESDGYYSVATLKICLI